MFQVKARTSNYNTYSAGSHVMEYGNKTIKAERLYLYQGFNPESVNFPANRLLPPMDVVNQRDADLLFLWQRVSYTLPLETFCSSFIVTSISCVSDEIILQCNFCSTKHPKTSQKRRMLSLNRYQRL